MSWPNVAAFGSLLVAILVPLLTFVRSGRSDRVAEDISIKAELRDLSNRFNALEDYTYQLRRDLEKTGIKPRPWPAVLGGGPDGE